MIAVFAITSGFGIGYLSTASAVRTEFRRLVKGVLVDSGGGVLSFRFPVFGNLDTTTKLFELDFPLSGAARNQ